MSDDPIADAKRRTYERVSILSRLDAHATIYVARPDGQEAVRELKARGDIQYEWGQGADAGMMIVRKAARPAPRPIRGGGVA